MTQIVHGLVLAVVLLLTADPVRAQDPVTIKMGTLAPDASPWMEAWYAAAASIEARAPVPVQIVSYPGGVMGDEPDLVRRLKLNQLQIVGVSVSGIAKLVPELVVLALPYLFQSYAEVDHIVSQFLPRFRDYADRRGLVLYNIGESGLVSTFSVNHPQTLQDFREQRVWIWNSDPIGVKLAELLDVNAVFLGVPEVRVGLQTRMVDTVFGTPTILAAMQWQDHVNYHFPEPVAYSPAVMLGTKAAFDRIPAAHRAKFDALFREIAASNLETFKEHTRAIDRRLAGELASHGIQQVQANPYLHAATRILAAQVWEELAGTFYPAELLTAIKRELAAFRGANGATADCATP